MIIASILLNVVLATIASDAYWTIVTAGVRPTMVIRWAGTLG